MPTSVLRVLRAIALSAVAMRTTLGLLAVAGLAACASTKITGGATMARCPVCEEEFVRDPSGVGGGVSSHGLMPRYLSEPREVPGGTNAYFPGSPRVLTCPYCLYSAAAPGFADIDEEERARLRKALAELSLPAGAGLAIIEIARVCERARRPHPRPEVDLELHAYLSRWRERTPQDRRRMRGLLGRALSTGAVSGRDRAPILYLVGEISHQVGRADEARRLFEASARVARPLDDLAWIPGWAAAQIRRIEMESWTAGDLGPLALEARPIARGDSGSWPPPGDPEIAVQVLARRDDPEAWAVLEDFVGEDAGRLHALVRITDLDPERMRLAPDLHAFAEDRYLRHGDDLLSSAVFEKGMAASRVRRRALERFEAELAGHPPSPGTRDAVLDALPSLIEEGSEKAARCLLQLVARPGAGRTDYRVGESIEAVARTPALWPLIRESLPPPTPETDRVHLLLAVASGARPGLSEELVDRLEERSSGEEGDLLLGVLGAMGDHAAVAYALQTCQEPGSAWCLHYLAHVGGPKEAREIARKARWAAHAGDRKDLEDCLRSIHIRLASPPEPAPGPATAAALR